MKFDHVTGRIKKKTIGFCTFDGLKMLGKASPLVFAVVAIVASCVRDCRGFSPALPRSAINSPPSFSSSNDVPSGGFFSTSFRRNANLFGKRRNPRSNFQTTRFATMSDDAAFLSNDPFIILGLDAPTADKKVLKRAYKKRALKFHPDVVTDIHSTPEEKKKASDRFAKINGAYEQLMGKGKGNGKTGDDATSSSSSDGWTPPHRRTSSYKSSSSSQSSYSEGGSTDWKDYMPNYDENYDTGGDSFSQIFSDIFTGAASAAVSGGIGGVGGGIFNEFLEFLEGGAGAGFAGGNEDDADLRDLLKTGTMEEVAEEMDDTEMVVKQLETKSKGLDDEIFALDAEARMASRFSEKISLEEKGAELKARKDVVTRYLERARRRLLSLQTRYKDLIAYGGAADDSAASGGRRENPSSWSDVRDESYSSSSQSSRSSSSYGSRAEPSSTSGTEGRTNADDNDDNDKESWRTEGFGSGRSRGSSRRRGSARRRASSRRSSASSTEGNSSPPSPSPAPPPSYSTTETRSGRSPRPPPRTTSTSPSTSRSRSTSTSTSTSTISKSNYSYDVPPHRRTTGSSSFASRQEEDRKRMSEIKVDEEFEKLKKELGL